MITEDQLEQLCLDWFRAGGYEYAYGPDIAFDGDTPERSDYLQVVLTGRLLTALQKINPHIPLATLEEAAQAVTKPESPVLIHNNRKVSPQICFENSRKRSLLQKSCHPRESLSGIQSFQSVKLWIPA